MKHKSFIISIALFVFITLCGCTQTLTYDRALLERLRNRGPVPLSVDNPYLAANLLISKEMERSEEIRGFIEHRGAPPALSVEKSFLGPTSIEFFYPQAREFYVFDEAGEGWVVSGPFSLTGELSRELSVLTRGLSNEPALSIPFKPKKSVKEERGLQQGSEKLPLTPPKISESAPTQELPGGVPLKSAPFKSPATPPSPLVERITPAISSASKKPLTIQEIIQKVHAPEGELTPRGDLVHYVTTPNETLETIALWYTLEASNGPKIGRINRQTKPLGEGDSLVIPRYMLKNRSRLTDEALKLLKGN